jgi:hypothetical protein
MEPIEVFVGPWNSKFDVVPDLTEEEKEALYGLIKLATPNININEKSDKSEETTGTENRICA